MISDAWCLDPDRTTRKEAPLLTSFAEVSALTDRELDARIDLARSTEHPALAALITERDRRDRTKLRNVYTK